VAEARNQITLADASQVRVWAREALFRTDAPSWSGGRGLRNLYGRSRRVSSFDGRERSCLRASQLIARSSTQRRRLSPDASTMMYWAERATPVSHDPCGAPCLLPAGCDVGPAFSTGSSRRPRGTSWGLCGLCRLSARLWLCQALPGSARLCQALRGAVGASQAAMLLAGPLPRFFPGSPSFAASFSDLGHAITPCKSRT
jgi:hypothetical protein